MLKHWDESGRGSGVPAAGPTERCHGEPDLRIRRQLHQERFLATLRVTVLRAVGETSQYRLIDRSHDHARGVQRKPSAAEPDRHPHSDAGTIFTRRYLHTNSAVHPPSEHSLCRSSEHLRSRPKAGAVTQVTVSVRKWAVRQGHTDLPIAQLAQSHLASAGGMTGGPADGTDESFPQPLTGHPELAGEPRSQWRDVLPVASLDALGILRKHCAGTEPPPNHWRSRLQRLRKINPNADTDAAYDEFVHASIYLEAVRLAAERLAAQQSQPRPKEQDLLSHTAPQVPSRRAPAEEF